jgi:hypothetical protein
MSHHHATIVQLAKMVRNMDNWLDRAEVLAKDKSFDPAVLLAARIAPDQYPLVRQIQAACDAAKFAAARASGKEAPKHPDTEQTLAEIRARIAACAAYLDSFGPDDFAGTDTRLVALPFIEGKAMLAPDYLSEMALPNFYFHLVTAYAILRHNGVDLGKRDFIRGLTLRDL